MINELIETINALSRGEIIVYGLAIIAGIAYIPTGLILVYDFIERATRPQ